MPYIQPWIQGTLQAIATQSYTPCIVIDFQPNLGFLKNCNDDGTKKPESDIPKPDDQQKLRLHKVGEVMDSIYFIHYVYCIQ